MPVLAHDLNFMLSIARPFFGQRHIRRTLDAIHAESISGWEKWLQIEMATFIRQHEDVKAWGRETQYKLDKRVAKFREKCAVDFIVHQRRKHSHIALEIKQTNALTACIGGMLRDKRKIRKIRPSEFDIRSVWCLGVHMAAPCDEVERKIKYYSSKFGVNLENDLFASEAIGRTGFSFTLL